jgi:type IV secretory pathway TraG/TraD family ATPase VirD4
MKEAVQDNPSMSSLMHNIMRCSLDEMVNACKGTDAASVFDSEGMKMAASIRSVISSEVQILRVMDTDKGDFSVRDWVNNESEGFIFVSTLKDQEEALRPFITLLCDIFMNSVMTLKPDFNRRIWILLDEAQALGNLKSLPSYLAESRKYGGCCMAGFQGYSQAKRIYGDEGVEELSDLFATFIVMACNGNKTAEWSAKQLGKSDNIEVNESLSYGLNSARDGANLQNTRRERDVVMPSQLQNLDDL